MYELINLFCHPAISQFLMVAISFDIACKELKISRLAQASFHGIRRAEGKFPPVRRKAEIEQTIEKKTKLNPIHISNFTLILCSVPIFHFPRFPFLVLLSAISEFPHVIHERNSAYLPDPE